MIRILINITKLYYIEKAETFSGVSLFQTMNIMGNQHTRKKWIAQSLNEYCSMRNNTAVVLLEK